VKAPAIRLGVSCLVTAGVLAVTLSQWAWIPLVFLVVVSVAAPFVPTWGYFLPVHAHGPRTVPQVAITFDDGPDPATTPRLLDRLDSYGVSACFFVIGDKVNAHPELARSIVERGHEVGNHSTTHDPILMLRSSARLEREIDGCQIALAALDIHVSFFRPPVGITNPRLGPVLASRNMTCVNFSLRPWDGGNRRLEGLAQRVLTRVRAGDVILLHDRCPADPHAVDQWLEEVDAILSGLTSSALAVVPLSKILTPSS
jgi:peptidoglycan-N-acetylglucosamine deacetylase